MLILLPFLNDHIFLSRYAGDAKNIIHWIGAILDQGYALYLKVYQTVQWLIFPKNLGIVSPWNTKTSIRYYDRCELLGPQRTCRSPQWTLSLRNKISKKWIQKSKPDWKFRKKEIFWEWHKLRRKDFLNVLNKILEDLATDNKLVL